MKIEVDNPAVVERPFTKDGKTIKFREQQAYAHVLDRDGRPLKYPQKVVISLPEGASAYAPGLYTVGEGSYYIDAYDKLALGALKLVPLPSKGG